MCGTPHYNLAYGWNCGFHWISQRLSRHEMWYIRRIIRIVSLNRFTSWKNWWMKGIILWGNNLIFHHSLLHYFFWQGMYVYIHTYTFTHGQSINHSEWHNLSKEREREKKQIHFISYPLIIHDGSWFFLLVTCPVLKKERKSARFISLSFSFPWGWFVGRFTFTGLGFHTFALL